MSCCNSNNVNALLNRCSKNNRGNNLVNHFNERINKLENKELDLNNISSNIIPDLDQTYNLGSEEKKFKDLYLSGNTLYLGSIQLKENGGTLEVKDSNGQNALDLTTIEEQVNKNNEDITILNNNVQNFNKNIEVTNELLVTGNLCYQGKPALYSNINEISSSTVVPVQSSGIYKNIGNSQITLTLDGTSETTTLESGNSKLIYASTTKLFSVQTNLPQPYSEPEPNPIVGTWKLVPREGALKVGQDANDGGWWQNNSDDVVTRSSLFDDRIVFNSDGSFQNIMGSETWLETWQGVNADGPGTPVYPHDGSVSATWSINGDNTEIRLNGLGAHVGLPRATNNGELSIAGVTVPDSRTYLVTFNEDNTEVIFNINFRAGWWTFTYERV